MMLRFIAPVLLILLCSTQMEAQLNFYAGYRLGFITTNSKDLKFNDVIERHNEIVEMDSTIEYRTTVGLEELSFLNGVDLGISYQFPGSRIQFGWMNKRKQIRAEGERTSNSNTFENRITTTVNNLNFGFYPTFGPVYIGATIDYNFLRIKSDFEERGETGIPNAEDFAYSNAWSSHFSIGYDLSNGGSIGLKIEPYIQLYWSDYDLSTFHRNVTGETIPEEIRYENLGTFGIAFIIYNGPQKR